jgi:predicted amidohydrolase YtcJ
MKADKILVNGTIYTASSKPSNFLAIAGDRILAVGKGAGKAYIGRSTEVINLHGMFVTPGLTDSHVHFLDYAFSLTRVRFDSCKTRAEILEMLKERASRTVPGEWIQGRGWKFNHFNGFPHRAILDEIFPDNPVVLNSHDEHFRWLNSKALEIAGITGDTKVPGGLIGLDSDGLPNGLLGENAVALIRPFVEQPDDASRRSALLTAQQRFHRMGISSFHSMDANQAFGDLQELKADGLLKLRVFHSVPVRQLEQAVEIGMKSGMGDEWFQFGMVKIFSDGALGSHSALMLKPYDEVGGTGIETMEQAELERKIHLALSNGIAAAVHAIGDRANRQVLNAFEKNAHLLNVPRVKSRIEHAQLLDPQDIPRFQKLGIIASMQPYHAISDCQLAERYWGKRSRYSYAWRSLLDTGANLIFGSDAPVEDPDPLPALLAAVHRQNWKDRSETITADQALLAYTFAPAYSSGVSRDRGSIEPGKLADLTIFSDDPIRSGFRGIAVTGTMVGGEFVYRDFE